MNFKTLEEIKENEGQQVTGRQLLNNRMFLKNNNWSVIVIDPLLKRNIIEIISNIYGGTSKTKEKIKSILNNPNGPRHWTLDRFYVEKYGDKPAILTYCAGQDEAYELKEARNWYNKL